MAILPDSIRNGMGEELTYYIEQTNTATGTKPVVVGKLDVDNEFDTPLNDTSATVQTVDYSELIKGSTFLGEYPFDTIIEGLEEQFSDYMNLDDDNTDYVDVFYNQLDASIAAINEDEEEEHIEEKMEILTNYQNEFIDKMSELFNRRLTITFMDVDGDTRNYDDIEYVLRTAYRFFILNARQNFMDVIVSEVFPSVKDIIEDNEYFQEVNSLVDQYSPYITTIGPVEFVKYTGDEEILSLLEEGRIVGNFLRKYSPNLRKNESFKIDIINHITTHGMKDEF